MAYATALAYRQPVILQRVNTSDAPAWVAKSVYARDLKSLGRKVMRVQVPPQAPDWFLRSTRCARER